MKTSARHLFSEIKRTNAGGINEALQVGSNNSGLVAATREEVYRKTFSNFDYLVDRHTRIFNSAQPTAYSDSASALTGVHAIDATVRAYVNSIAGFFCKEVNLDQAAALINHFDTLEVLTGNVISPNMGAVDKSSMKNNYIKTKVTVTADAFTLNSGKRLIPASVKITAYKGAVLVATLMDNGQGKLLAPADVITAGTVNYETGAVTATFKTGTVDSVTIEANADNTGEDNIGGNRNHVKGKMVGFIMQTLPQLLTYESNIIQSVAANKALNVDMDVYLAERLAELYTIQINQRISNCIDSNYVGDVNAIDMSAKTYDNVRSYSDYFYNKITESGQVLAEKAYRGASVNAYLVGKKAAIPFLKMAQVGVFEKVQQTNFVGLIGYLDGNIPVIRTDDIAPEVGYQVHRSDNGEIAPVLRGMFLPLTNTPQVGNYDNPTQVSGGIYFQEQCTQLYPQVVQKFTVANETSY